MSIDIEQILNSAKTMEDNVYKTYEAGKRSIFTSNECLKGSVSGSIVSMSDVSPVEHNVPCKIYSQNLFDVSKVPSTSNGYITNNGDGTITISGGYSCGTSKKLSVFCPSLKVGDVVTLSLVTDGQPLIYLNGSNKNWDNGKKLTITEEDLNSTVNLYGKSDKGTYTISQIWINYSDAVSAYTPYVADISTAKVQRLGKNLFDKDEITRKFSVGDYETSDDTNSYSVVSVQLKPNTKYCVKINGSQNGSQTFINYRKKVNTTSGISISTNWAATEKVFTTNETGKLYVGTYGKANRQKIGEVLDIALVQVEEGTVATEYEEYREQTYTSNADGVVEGVTSIYPSMTILTDTDGVGITTNYYKDIDKVFENLAINVALSGGE